MIVSSSARFVFVHIYKTAGSSIRRVLERYDDAYGFRHRIKSLLTPNPVLIPVVAERHADAATIRAAIGAAVFEGYFKFGFVRNPWDWQKSLYKQILKDTSNHHHPHVKALGSFEKYIQWRCTEDTHLQREFLFSTDGRQLVDYIGRYENLQGDFDSVCDRISLPRVQLPNLNRSEPDGYRSFYSSISRDLVARSFEADIDTFGYEF